MDYIHNADLKPLFLVPGRWNVRRAWSLDGPRFFRFAADQAMRLVDFGCAVEEMEREESANIITVETRNFKGVVYAILHDGGKYLIDHPEVASFPRARQ